MNFVKKPDHKLNPNLASDLALSKNEMEIVKIYQNFINNYITSKKNIRDEIKKKSFEFFKTQGNKLISINNFDVAIIYFKEALHNNPNDVTCLNNIGFAFINKNLYEEAVYYLKKANKLFPNLPNILNNLGMALTKIGKIQESKKFLLNAIKINPEYVSAIYNLGIMYLDLKDYNSAIVEFKKVLIINPQFHQAYPKLSKAYNLIGQFQEAITINKKGILLFPSLPDLHNSMGITYYNIKNYPEALELFNKSFKLDSRNYNALNNIGNVYLKKGAVNNALEAYIKALEIKFPFSEASNSLLSLLIQKKETSELIYQKMLFKIEMNAIINNDLLGLIYFCINAYITDKWTKAKSLLAILNQHNFNNILDQTQPNKKFMIAYKGFLNNLIMEPAITNEKINHQDIIYHIGDSHSLSFAYQNVNYKDKKKKIVPYTIFGAKAFHFAKPNKNSFKSYLKNYINQIPNKSTILISFGEIDCRTDEGISKYYNKNTISLDKIIKKTVTGFVDFMTEEFKNRNSNIFFLGVHAPVFNPNKSEKINELQIMIIKQWNLILSKTLENSDYKFINTYKATSNKFGFSNLKYMCDEIHLKPSFINTISKMAFHN